MEARLVARHCVSKWGRTAILSGSPQIDPVLSRHGTPRGKGEGNGDGRTFKREIRGNGDGRTFSPRRQGLTRVLRPCQRIAKALRSTTKCTTVPILSYIL